MLAMRGKGGLTRRIVRQDVGKTHGPVWPAGAGASRYDGVLGAADSLGAGVEAQLAGGLVRIDGRWLTDGVYGVKSEVGESASGGGDGRGVIRRPQWRRSGAGRGSRKQGVKKGVRGRVRGGLRELPRSRKISRCDQGWKRGGDIVRESESALTPVVSV